MKRALSFIFGLIAYSAFLVTILYAIGFVGGFAVPKAIDTGAAVPFTEALLVNLALLGAFAVQHSAMARPAFKRWWTRIVPEPVERSTYVLISSALLGLLFWQWRPMHDIVWSVGSEASTVTLYVLYAAGWAMVFLSTFLINHFDLFGMRQVYIHLIGRTYTPIGYRTPLLYKLVRHPLMLGFLIAFWSAPVMTVGHVVFAGMTTIYILIALQLEEHDLVTMLGDKYRDYQRDVPMLVPFTKRRGKERDAAI